MKVLHVIPSVSPLRGGPSEAVLQMVNALRSQGIDAEIITTNDHGEDVLNVPLYERVEYLDYHYHQYSQNHSKCHPVPIRFFPRFSPPIAAIREFAFSESLFTWLCLNVRQYDLIHVHAIFSWASTIAMVIARLQNVPYIVRPLGQLCHWSLQQGQRKKQIYLKLIEQSNLNQARSIHFTSEQEQQEAIAVGLQTPSFVLPHGLAIPNIRSDAQIRLRQWLNLPPDEPIILFLSRLHSKKGLEYLIPALSRLQSHRFTFVLAGNASPGYELEVEQLLQTTGLNQRSRRLGFVSGETKNLLLQGSDLFALTSHSENFGIAVLEAMANGLPVVITPGVALASLVERSHLGWVTPLEESNIAAAVEQFFHDSASAKQSVKQMGERARSIVAQHYSWSSIASKLIEHYQSLLSTTQSLNSERLPSNSPLPAAAQLKVPHWWEI